MFGQIGVDLRTRAVDQHQADAQTMQQPYIIDNAWKVLMLNGFAAKHDDKRLAPMSVNIGDWMTKPLDQFGSTFLHHGTTLNAWLFVIIVFLFCFCAKRKPEFA